MTHHSVAVSFAMATGYLKSWQKHHVATLCSCICPMNHELLTCCFRQKTVKKDAEVGTIRVVRTHNGLRFAAPTLRDL